MGYFPYEMIKSIAGLRAILHVAPQAPDHLFTEICYAERYVVGVPFGQVLFSVVIQLREYREAFRGSRAAVRYPAYYVVCLLMSSPI